MTIRSSFYAVVGLFNAWNLYENFLKAMLLKQPYVSPINMYTCEHCKHTHTISDKSLIIRNEDIWRTTITQMWRQILWLDCTFKSVPELPSQAKYLPIYLERCICSKSQKQFGPLYTVMLSEAPEPNLKNVIKHSQILLTYNEISCFCTLCPNWYLSIFLPLEDKRASTQGCYSY